MYKVLFVHLEHPKFRRFFYLFLFFFSTLPNLHAQKGYSPSSLSIPQIMQGEGFVGYLPQRAFWAEDNASVYFSWNPEMDTLRSLYKIDLPGTKAVKVSVEEQKGLPGNGVYDAVFKHKVYAKNGDIFLMEVATGKLTAITATTARESNPRFVDQDRKISFVRSQNVYTWDISSGAIHQLTNLKSGSASSTPSLNEQEQWLENDQLAYFQILKERKEKAALREANQETLAPSRPSEFYYGKKRVSNMQVSPDLKFVSFRLTTPARAKRTKVPDFVTESGYLNDLNSRPKVGSKEDTYELGIYDVERDTYLMVETKNLDGIYAKPAYLYEYHTGEEEFKDSYDSPKPVIIHGPFFSADSKAAVVLRSMDNKDRWICLLDMQTGTLEQLDWQHDEAWIGGPGISGWNFTPGTIGWLADNKHLYFQSEVTGFSHLYALNVETKEKKALTNGKFEIINVELSKDKKTFYLTANKEGPQEHHFYHLPITGGELKKITNLPGNNDVTISPNEKQLLIRYSYSNQPWELYVMDNKPGAKAKRLTKSTTEAFGKYPWRDPEIVYFKASDGARVPARIYRPEKPEKKGPAVIFVHGAGYLQNVHKWWSSYYREYMFHNYLVDNGYTVLDIDYRASNGYGRNWRTAIYRHMGGKDLSDQVDGAKFLTESYDIDPERIGIYGGSYGGFITLMALFKNPGVFKAGAALRSVTDWAHYNHPYTSNILNTPATDSLAYFKSSPIYHAEGLQDNLVILHGMVDTNVQFQDVVRLAQRLIELGKDNWEFAVFPQEGHGFVEPSSWTDEYKRIFKIFEENLK